MGSPPDKPANDQSSGQAGDGPSDTTGTGGPFDLAGGIDGKDGPGTDANSVADGSSAADGAGDSGDSGGGGSGGRGGTSGGGAGGVGGNGGTGAGGTGGSGTAGSGVGGAGTGGAGTGGAAGTTGGDAGVDLGSLGADAADSGTDAREAGVDTLHPDSAAADGGSDASNPDLIADANSASDVMDGLAISPAAQGPDVVDGPAADSGLPPPGDATSADVPASPDSGSEGGSADAPATTGLDASLIQAYGVVLDAGLGGLPAIAGLAVDQNGNQFIAGSLYNTANLGSGSVTSAGNGDLLIAKLDPATLQAVWTKNFGDTADQQGTGVAVSHAGRVGVIGNFTGAMTIGNAISDPLPSAVDFIAAVDASGAGLWARVVNTQSGALLSMAGNLAQESFVVCGYAMGAATDLDPNAPTNPDKLRDVLIAKIDAATGTTIWGHQFGGAGTQSCGAATMDDNGDVYATGSYNGTLDFGLGAFSPAPPTAQQLVWVAKFDGGTGAVIASKSYGSINKQYPKGIAVYGSGTTAKVAITGNMKSTLAFGSTTLTSPGGTDGFLAELDSNLNPLWAKNWGDDQDQEAHSVAFDSAGELVVVGLMNGDATFVSTTPGSTTLHTNGTVASDAYWAKFSPDGTSAIWAQRYGDTAGQTADVVAIASAATGAQKDVVSVAGYFTGSIDDLGLSPITTTATQVGYLLVLHP